MGVDQYDELFSAYFKKFLPFFLTIAPAFILLEETYIKDDKLYSILLAVSYVILKTIFAELSAFAVWSIIRYFEVKNAVVFQTPLNFTLIRVFCLFITEIITYPSLPWKQRILQTIFLNLILIFLILSFGYLQYLYLEWKLDRFISLEFLSPARHPKQPARQIIIPSTTSNQNAAVSDGGIYSYPPPINSVSNQPSMTFDADGNTTFPTRVTESASRVVMEPTADGTAEGYSTSENVNGNTSTTLGIQIPNRERQSSVRHPNPSTENIIDARRNSSSWTLVESKTRSGTVYFSSIWNAKQKILVPVNRPAPNRRCTR